MGPHVSRIAELAGRELRWVKADRASGGGYQLRDGDDVVATLGFRSLWGTLATATIGDGCWTFKRVGAGAAFTAAPWLVMLGWYVTVQMHDDAAVASSATVASS